MPSGIAFRLGHLVVKGTFEEKTLYKSFANRLYVIRETSPRFLSGATSTAHTG